MILAASPAPSAVRAPAADCPRENGHIIEESKLRRFRRTRTRRTIACDFSLDLGSDGRVRRTALAESSGDASVDAAAAKAVTEFRYAAPSIGCVSTSTVSSQWWRMPPEALASPTVPEPARVELAGAVRGAVRSAASRAALPQRREVPGYRASWTSRWTRTRASRPFDLVQSSGNKKTDYVRDRGRAPRRLRLRTPARLHAGRDDVRASS